MNWRAIRAIIRKDLQVVVQSKAVLYPLISLPIILLVILPGLGGIFLSSVEEDSQTITDFRGEMGAFYDNLPESISSDLDQFDSEVQRIAYLLFNNFFAPMFLIVPLMAASVIAADSFAGEKERKTLEALIYTPTTDNELYVAKLLSPLLAALAVTWVGFIGYAIVLNVSLLPVMERVFFPDLSWLVMILWLAPAAAGLGLGVMVLVSSRVSTFQEAYQLGGLVVVPVVLLLFGQLGGVIYFEVPLVIIIGLIVWLVDAGIIWYGARLFNRGELIARL